MPSTNVLCVEITRLISIPEKMKKKRVWNAVYFRLCIDLVHITSTVTAEGFDASHHPRYAE